MIFTFIYVVVNFEFNFVKNNFFMKEETILFE